MVPRTAVMSNPLTASLITSRHSEGWLGPAQPVLGYFVAGGQLYNVAVLVPRPSDAPLVSWNTPGDVEEMGKLFVRFRDAVRTPFSLVEIYEK
jgi:salicylate hydroxylase